MACIVPIPTKNEKWRTNYMLTPLHGVPHPAIAKGEEDAPPRGKISRGLKANTRSGVIVWHLKINSLFFYHQGTL